MPKDQWKKANNRARFGPGHTEPRSEYRPTASERAADRLLSGEKAKRNGKRKRLKTAKAYHVPAGSPCFVAAPGSKKWVPHTTTVDATFTSYQPADSGGRWIFTRPDGWRMKVATNCIRRSDF